MRAWKKQHGSRFPEGPPYDVAAVRCFLQANAQRTPRRPLAAEIEAIERVVVTAEAQAARARAPRADPSSDDASTSIGGLIEVRGRVRELLDDADAADQFPRFADLLNRIEDQIRKRETADLELAKARGEVVDREDARSVIFKTIEVARQEMRALLGSLGARVVQWSEDDRWRALSTNQKKLEVHHWAEGQLRAVAALDPDDLLARAAAAGEGG